MLYLLALLCTEYHTYIMYVPRERRRLGAGSREGSLVGVVVKVAFATVVVGQGDEAQRV